jgi:hypothetical protein
MRALLFALVLLTARASSAWDTEPHQRITKAALDSLSHRASTAFGAEVSPLAEIYCMYPDRYLEMSVYGFVRRSPGPGSAAEILAYCIRPDGQLIHGCTGERSSDSETLGYLFQRIRTNLAANRPGEAARYSGVLAHFIEDSLSPPHAVTAERLRAMEPPSAEGKVNVHGLLERSVPNVSLAGYAPRRIAARVDSAAAVAMDRCYEGAAENRRDLPSMVRAACAGDERTLDRYRRRAGLKAAEILADALDTLLAAR